MARVASVSEDVVPVMPEDICERARALQIFGTRLAFGDNATRHIHAAEQCQHVAFTQCQVVAPTYQPVPLGWL